MGKFDPKYQYFDDNYRYNGYYRPTFYYDDKHRNTKYYLTPGYQYSYFDDKYRSTKYFDDEGARNNYVKKNGKGY